MNLKIERYPEGVIGAEGNVCAACFGMGESGSRFTPTRWAYGDPITSPPTDLCDTCLVGIHARLTAHIAEHHITARPKTPSPIPNALSETEWRIAKLWHAGKMVGGKVRGMVVLDLPDEHKHGAAALALYGMPFGFTQEELTTLRQPPDDVLGWYQTLDIVLAKIAALLPPETP